MQIGKHTYGHQGIQIYTFDTPANLIIGSFCSIASDCKVFLGGDHRTDWITTYPFGHTNQHIFNGFDGMGHPKSNGDVIIGNDVWICAGSTIMSGVTICDGAVIAANSHVVKNVDPYTIVGGNPAKPIKKRFSTDVIEKLLKLKWWEWDDTKINQYSPVLCSNNFEHLFTLAGIS